MMMMMMIQIQTNGTPEVTLITKQTQSKNLCKKRGQTQPGLVAFYVQSPEVHCDRLHITNNDHVETGLMNDSRTENNHTNNSPA